jgi:hypothetical protein
MYLMRSEDIIWNSRTRLRKLVQLSLSGVFGMAGEPPAIDGHKISLDFCCKMTYFLKGFSMGVELCLQMEMVNGHG